MTLAVMPSMAMMTTPAPAVRAVGLSKWIEDRPILDGIDLLVSGGASLALLGSNGAGKSTLLQVLATLSPPTDGRLFLFGQPLSHRASLRARIGMVGHQAMLYRDLSALENLVFFGRLYGVERASERAGELLERVGLADRAGDPVKAFSRGMLQRVAIARALMHDPELLLADEPFTGLDVRSTATLEELLGGLHRQGKTVILVNHDVAQSLRLVERVVVLRRGRVVLDRAARQVDESEVMREVSAS